MKERSEKYKIADQELEQGIDSERQESSLKRQAPNELREQSKTQDRQPEKQQDLTKNKVLPKTQEPLRESLQEAKVKQLDEPRREFRRDNDLDPESAKWAEARDQGKQELAQKVQSDEQEKARKLSGDPWQQVQVEGYNKAAYREELAEEKAKEQGKSAEQDRGKAKS